MKFKTNIKVVGIEFKHSQTAAKGLKVKSGVKVGSLKDNIDSAFIRR